MKDGKKKDKSLEQVEKELFDTSGSNRQGLERQWYRNILYYLGEQWIQWSKAKKGFVSKYQNEADTPRPVDNIILEYVRSVKALILNKDIDYKVWPNSNERDDVQAAELGEMLLKDMDLRNSGRNEEEKELAILWMLLSGTGFIRDYPNMGVGKWIADTSLKTGDVSTEAIMPFNVFVDEATGSRLSEKRFVGIQALRPKEWVKETFPEYDSEQDSTSQDGGQINYQRGLMRLVGQISEWRSYGTSVLSSSTDSDMVLFREIEFAPTKEYPQGRYTVRCNGQTLVDIARLPVKTGTDGEWRYSIDDLRHNIVPGRFWGEAGMNALISPQNTINRIDSALIRNREGVGRPTFIGAIGMKLRTKTRKGSSVNMLEYDPITSAGTAPTVRYGIPLPSQVITERSMQKDAAQQSSGDPKNVLRGDAPSGSSGVMVDIMRESAEASHAPDIARVIRAFQRSARKRLIIAQEIYTEKRILKISGVKGKYSVQEFKGADLKNNTDVRLEVISGFATTNAGRVNTIMQLIQAGIFNPQVVDPSMRDEISRLMGVKSFSRQSSPDLERAEIENSRISNGEADQLYVEVPLLDDNGEVPTNPADGSPVVNPDGSPMVVSYGDPLFEYDDHAIHFETHRKFIISTEFTDVPEEDQVIAISHLEAHKKRLEIAQLQQQQAMAEQQQMEAEQKNPQMQETPQ